MDARAITAALELPGFEIVENVGIVRGIVVRSRSVVGNFFAGFQTFFGGNITIYTTMCERARGDAYQLMVDQARHHGGNAIIAVRYDTTEILPGVTEVLCYGTAVLVRPSNAGGRARGDARIDERDVVRGPVATSVDERRQSSDERRQSSDERRQPSEDRQQPSVSGPWDKPADARPAFGRRSDDRISQNADTLRVDRMRVATVRRDVANREPAIGGFK
jgi:uncharacterized protein YbjQ (UPF0145 family)